MKADPLQQCQRVQVTRDSQGAEQAVRISVERYDAALGWYTAGSLSIPLCQLPLLEQALHDLSVSECAACPESVCLRKIIPFPLLAAGARAETPADTANCAN